jgi:hypothetical protein
METFRSNSSLGLRPARTRRPFGQSPRSVRRPARTRRHFGQIPRSVLSLQDASQTGGFALWRPARTESMVLINLPGSKMINDFPFRTQQPHSLVLSVLRYKAQYLRIAKLPDRHYHDQETLQRLMIWLHFPGFYFRNVNQAVL